MLLLFAIGLERQAESKSITRQIVSNVRTGEDKKYKINC